MTLARSLSKMSREEKLVALETIWADLSRDEAEFKSPAWHSTELKKSEGLVSSGTAKFTDWDAAKQRIRRKAARLA